MASLHQPDTVAAGALTREQVATSLIPALSADTVTLAMGPHVLLADRGSTIKLPRLDTFDLDNPWRGESELISDAEGHIESVELLPQTLKSLKGIARVSNELLKRSVPELLNLRRTEGTSANPFVHPGVSDQSVADALFAYLTRTLDAAFLTGSGAGDTVRGLINIPGVQNLPVDGPVTLDDLHLAEGMALEENAKPAVWIMHPRVLVRLRMLKDAQGRYQVTPDPREEGAYRLLGHRVLTTSQIPLGLGSGDDGTVALLVDPQQIWVGIDEAIRFKRLDERYAEFDETGIRMVVRADITSLNPKGVVVLRGIDPGA